MSTTEQTFFGTPISSGLAFGKAVIEDQRKCKGDLDSGLASGNSAEEIARVKQAFQLLLVATECLESLFVNKVEKNNASVFALQKVLMEELSLRQRIIQLIQEKSCGAEEAICKIMDQYKNRLVQSHDVNVQEKIFDLVDLQEGLIDALKRPQILFNQENKSPNEDGPLDRIAVTKELTPRFVMEQNMRKVKGIIAEQAGKTSHAAILCRAFGIPTVGGLEGITELGLSDSSVLVDGTKGLVIISPQKTTLENSLPRRTARGNLRTPLPAQNTETKLRLMANILFAADVWDALNVRSDGVGLYRTEFEFMAARKWLDPDEQFVLYKSVVEAMAGKPVNIRMLDLQEDKNISNFAPLCEGKIYSGSFGAQFLLENEKIFRSQAVSIAMASVHGPIRVVYPMVADRNQFMELKSAFAHYASGIKTGEILHGAMLELPSACLDAGPIFKEADFGCIGSNDLVRNLFGLSRNNNSEFAQNISTHPILHEVVKSIATAAEKENRPLHFCGELAEKPENLQWLIDAGIGTISVPPASIPILREEMNRTSSFELPALDFSTQYPGRETGAPSKVMEDFPTIAR